MNHVYLTHFHVVDLYLQGKGFPGGAAVKNPPANTGGTRDIDPWVEKIPWRGKQQLTPAFLPEKSHGQRSLVHVVTKSRT